MTTTPRHRSAVSRKSPVVLVAGFLLLVGGCSQRADFDSSYHEFAYVSNGKSDSVSVIDTLALRNVKTIAVGKNPTGLATNPLRNEIYVANTESNNISIIDAERNEVVATIGVHRAPYFVSVSSDGKRAYVANSGSANTSVIDLDKRAVIATIPVGNAPGLAKVSPGRQRRGGEQSRRQYRLAHRYNRSLPCAAGCQCARSRRTW